jgi:hypothetical protein
MTPRPTTRPPSSRSFFNRRTTPRAAVLCITAKTDGPCRLGVISAVFAISATSPLYLRLWKGCGNAANRCYRSKRAGVSLRAAGDGGIQYSTGPGRARRLLNGCGGASWGEVRQHSHLPGPFSGAMLGVPRHCRPTTLNGPEEGYRRRCVPCPCPACACCVHRGGTGSEAHCSPAAVEPDGSVKAVRTERRRPMNTNYLAP